MAKALRGEGYEVRVASSGKEAMTALEEDRPDLVDHRMRFASHKDGEHPMTWGGGDILLDHGDDHMNLKAFQGDRDGKPVPGCPAACGGEARKQAETYQQPD